MRQKVVGLQAETIPSVVPEKAMTAVERLLQLNNPYLLETEYSLLFPLRDSDIASILGNTDGFKFNVHGIWLWQGYDTEGLIEKLNTTLGINLYMPNCNDSLEIQDKMRAIKMHSEVGIHTFNFIMKNRTSEEHVGFAHYRESKNNYFNTNKYLFCVRSIKSDISHECNPDDQGNTDGMFLIAEKRRPISRLRIVG